MPGAHGRSAREMANRELVETIEAMYNDSEAHTGVRVSIRSTIPLSRLSTKVGEAQ